MTHPGVPVPQLGAGHLAPVELPLAEAIFGVWSDFAPAFVVSCWSVWFMFVLDPFDAL